MNMSIGSTIHVTQFTAKTFEEWQKTLVKCFHSDKRMLSCKAGDIVVGTADRAVVVVGILKGVCTPCDLLDLDTYSGEDAKYNKYQFHLESYRILSKPVRFEDIRAYCGAPADDKTPNNLFRGMQSRAEAFYNKKGEASIFLDRYRALVAWWLFFPTGV
jgi:hypothetical protein